MRAHQLRKINWSYLCKPFGNGTVMLLLHFKYTILRPVSFGSWTSRQSKFNKKSQYLLPVKLFCPKVNLRFMFLFTIEQWIVLLPLYSDSPHALIFHKKNTVAAQCTFIWNTQRSNKNRNKFGTFVEHGQKLQKHTVKWSLGMGLFCHSVGVQLF